jgi:hypothetical protein
MYVIPELDNTYSKEGYTILNYKKMNNPNDLLRSVIYKNNKLVCFSPPKSIPYDTFKQQHPIQEIVVDEFIDGTMINVFYVDDNWVIATRSVVGAKCNFYSSKTFHEMFHETNINYNVLNTKYCYSFVLQHPENQIVKPIDTPKLYLIAVYQILDNTVYEVHVSNHGIHCFLTPLMFKFQSYEDAEIFVQNQPHIFKGLMLKSNNDRTKIRNLSYEKIKKLRGNSNNLKYTYLTIRSTPEQAEYEKYFPITPFAEYEKEIRDIITVLHDFYMSCFVYKLKPLREYDNKYKYHLYTLHQYYLLQLKHENKVMTKYEVKKYVNALLPSQLITLLSIQTPN